MSDEPSVTDLMARARNRDKASVRDTLVECVCPVLIWSICRRHRRYAVRGSQAGDRIIGSTAAA